MNKSKIIISYRDLRDAELEQKAQAIFAALTGNAAVPTPQPPLPELKTAIDEFDAAMLASANKDHVKVELKNLKREALLNVVNRLGQYVQIITNGDMELMLSTGFDLSKERTPVGPLSKPEGFKSVADGHGKVKLSLDAIEGAKTYQYEYRKLGDENWNTQLVTKSRLTLNGLQSGAAYQFRVVGLGSNTMRTYSEVISSFIL